MKAPRSKARNVRTPARRWIPVLTALSAVTLVGAGCLSDSESAGSPVALAASAASGESWVEAWDGTRGPRLPDLDTFVSTLGLDTDQTAVFAAAIAELNASVAAHQADIGGRGRVGGNRPGGHGMPGGAGEFEPPMFAFLEAVVPVLSVQQVEGLGEMMQAQERLGPQGPRAGEGPRGQGPRDGQGPRSGQGPRPGHGPGPGGFFADAVQDLDLSADQRTALRELGQESRQTFHALRVSFAEGTISAEQLRDQAKAAREELEASLSGILDETQLASLREALAEHRAEMAQRRIDTLETDIARRAEFLTAVLSLTDAQAGQVTALLNGTIAERTAVLTALRDGSIEIEDALYEGYGIATRTATALRALLDADQAAVFDALRGMLPGHRGPAGP